MIKMATERKRKYCPHCEEYVAVSTYYCHRDLYFKGGEWNKKTDWHSSGEDEFSEILISERTSESVESETAMDDIEFDEPLVGMYAS